MSLAASLKERLSRIRQDQAKSAPSLHPGPRAKKQKEQEPPPPDIRTLPLHESDMESLRALVQRYKEIAYQTKPLELEAEKIKVAIKVICNDYSLKKAIVDGRRLSYFSSSRKTISAKLLLDKGVSPAIILACTETSKPAWQFRITDPGEADETQEG